MPYKPLAAHPFVISSLCYIIELLLKLLLLLKRDKFAVLLQQKALVGLFTSLKNVFNDQESAEKCYHCGINIFKFSL